MARNDGIDRTLARNRDLSANDIKNAQAHNEREKETYSNPDIVLEQSRRNIHFKQPTGSYTEMFDQLKKDGVISTRGLKEDATTYCELLFDVNSAYFYNHGGYEFAKQFYADAYKAAVEIVGGEQYILSATMHADERNRAMSEALGEDVYHYHLHVVYIPVVEKQILWSKRCKDKSLIGTVKETIMQVSRSKKWESKPALDEDGNPLLFKTGKKILTPSYSILQDQFFNFMRAAGYTDVERGQRGSTEEHLTVTQFKVQAEQERLAGLEAARATTEAEIEDLEDQKIAVQAEAKRAADRLNELAPAVKGMEKLAREFSDDPEQILPEVGTLESAKSYREKKAKPLLAKIVKVLRSVYHAYLDLRNRFERLQLSYNRECSKTAQMGEQIDALVSENKMLRGIAADFDRAKKALGKEKMETAVESMKQQEAMMKAQKKKQKQYSR